MKSTTLTHDKQNIHPNLMHKYASLQLPSKDQHEPKVSKFKVNDSDWRKRIMLRSHQECQLQGQLDKMLKLQLSSKQSGCTSACQQKYVSEFQGEKNQTLQKYFHGESVSEQKKNTQKKKELVEILNLTQTLCKTNKKTIQNLPQQQLLSLIKSQLQALIPQ